MINNSIKIILYHSIKIIDIKITVRYRGFRLNNPNIGRKNPQKK
jgi:hypothetical protein